MPKSIVPIRSSDTRKSWSSFAGVIVRVNAAPGMSGAPAVDSAGRLLGLVQASDQQGLTVLIPAEDVFAFAAQA